MRNFYSIYPDTRIKDLMKPNGLIPYTLHKVYGYNTTIVTYNNENFEGDNNIEGVNLEYLKKIIGNPLIDGSIYILKNAKKIDILHTFFWKRENYFWFMLYKILNPKGKIYVTMDVDARVQEEHLKNKGLKGKIKKYFLKKCDLISAETKEMCDWLKKYWYEDIKYIPYGVLTSDKKVDYSTKENIIITVGRIGTYQKANEVLMEAYKKIHKDIPDWSVKVIGPVEEEFKQKIDEYYKKTPELKTKIKFTGPIFNRKDLMLEYEKAKIFCLTSRFESFGLVLSEAASRGDYIISTNIASAYDLTNNEKHGTIFEIDNIDELAQKLKEICLDEEKISKNCNKIQEFIRENYTWEAVCKKALMYLGEEI